MELGKTMQETSFAQYFTEKAERKNTIELLIDVLEFRFQTDDVETLKPIIENIEELQKLKQLHQEALQVSNLDGFKRILASNGTG